MFSRLLLGILATALLVPATASAAAPLGQLREFALPGPAAQPSGITSGPGNKIWFTEFAAQAVGNLDPVSATPSLPGFSEFPLSPNPGNPGRIVTGPDGNLWYTKVSANRIGRITPGGTVTEYDVSGKGVDGPFAITAGPDSKLWVTGYQNSTIASFSPGDLNGSFTVSSLKRFAEDPEMYPAGVAVGPDGNLWVATYGVNGSSNTLRAVDTSHKVVSGVQFQDGYDPDLELGLWDIISSGGVLWISARKANMILRFDPETGHERINIPTRNSEPAGLAADADGNVWFAEYQGNKIGRITNSWVSDEFELGSPNSYPEFLALGADGNIWFTESSNSAGKIGRVGTTPLTISVTKTGPGNVFSSPEGIGCSNICSHQFAYNTTVTLKATPLNGEMFKFAGWSGDCSGKAITCTLPMDRSYQVAATFEEVPWIKVADLKAKLSKGGAYLTSKLRLNLSGSVTQQASAGKKVWCKASRDLSPGFKDFKCNLGSKARRYLRKQKLKLKVTTTLKVKDKLPATVSSSLTVNKRR